jgi:hypothetical protein
MNRITHTLLIVAGLCLAGTAVAQDGPPQGEREGRRGPPPEAIEACEGLGSGDACGFDSPHGYLEGSCWAPSEELPLACRPADAPEPPR